MITKTTSSDRLAGIVRRQQGTFVRDVVFAAALVLAAIVSVASVATAVVAATGVTDTSAQVAQR